MTKDGKKLYVVNDKSQDISVIDTMTDKVIQTIKDPKIQLPYGITLAPDEKSIYITSKYAGFKVQQIDLGTGKVIKEVPTGAEPDHLRISPDGKELWVPINGTNEVDIIDLATFRLIKSVKLPGDTHEVFFVQVPDTFQADPSLAKPYIHVSFPYKYEEKSGSEPKVDATQTATTDEGLFQQKCSVCHAAPDPKDPTTLENFPRMVENAKLTAAEKDTLLNYIKKSQKK